MTARRVGCRVVLLGGALVLPGCAGLDGSFAGQGLGATALPDQGPNMRRVRGEATDAAPLLPEPGDIWAAPAPAVPDSAPAPARRAREAKRFIPSTRSRGQHE